MKLYEIIEPEELARQLSQLPKNKVPKRIRHLISKLRTQDRNARNIEQPPKKTFSGLF